MPATPDHDPLDPRRLPELADDLADLFGGRAIDVPRRADETIRARADRHFGPARSPRLFSRPGVRWAGVAAAIVITTGLAIRFSGVWRSTVAPGRALATGDVDGSGRVDILDALVLATHLELDRSIEAAWDVSGDGTVDQNDVKTIAMQAVSLNGGRGS